MRSRLALLARIAIAASLALAAASAPRSGAAEKAPRSGDIVSEVVRLLNNGLDSAVVSAWLDKQPPIPATLTPDELITLQSAGASSELVKQLIALSGQPAQAPAAPARPLIPTRPASAAKSSTVDLALAIAYKPRSYADDGNIPDEPDLYVYVDGKLLVTAQSQTGRLRDDPVELTTRLEPGAHTVRLLRERHERRGRKDDSPWRHEANVCPEAIDFVVGDGPGWRLEIDWIEPRFALRKSQPLGWRLTSGGTRVAGESGVGSPTDEWPEICEDIEAGLDAGKEPGKRTRRSLERCRRWSDLWPGTNDLPRRSELLGRFESNVANLMGATP